VSTAGTVARPGLAWTGLDEPAVQFGPFLAVPEDGRRYRVPRSRLQAVDVVRTREQRPDRPQSDPHVGVLVRSVGQQFGEDAAGQHRRDAEAEIVAGFGVDDGHHGSLEVDERVAGVAGSVAVVMWYVSRLSLAWVRYARRLSRRQRRKRDRQRASQGRDRSEHSRGDQ